MMQTTDLALVEDDIYYDIIESFAENENLLDDVFSKAWEKVTTQGGTWAVNKKCIDASDIKCFNKKNGDKKDADYYDF